MEEAPDTAWVVATGALTNVALLFATFPELAGHIKGLSIMGGAIGNGFTDAPLGEGERFGNHTRWAEFNIYVRLLYQAPMKSLISQTSVILKLLKLYSPVPNLLVKSH